MKEIAEKTDHFFVPLGIEKDLEKWGIEKERIQNFAWWEETEVDGLTIACTPARHYSIRNGLDRDDPPERIVKAGEEAGLTVATPYIGETMKLSEVESYQERWWKEIP